METNKETQGPVHSDRNGTIGAVICGIVGFMAVGWVLGIVPSWESPSAAGLGIPGVGTSNDGPVIEGTVLGLDGQPAVIPPVNVAPSSSPAPAGTPARPAAVAPQTPPATAKAPAPTTTAGTPNAPVTAPPPAPTTTTVQPAPTTTAQPATTTTTVPQSGDDDTSSEDTPDLVGHG